MKYADYKNEMNNTIHGYDFAVQYP